MPAKRSLLLFILFFSGQLFAQVRTNNNSIIPATSSITGYGSSESCNFNVTCLLGLGWEAETNSVVMLFSGSTFKGTGVLINNTCNLNIPYILTAYHNIAGLSNDEISHLSVVFQYWSPTCIQGPNPPVIEYLEGAILRAAYDQTDFALLELSQTPPGFLGVYYAGWNRSPVPATSTTCLHHPQGDVMKISTDLNAPVRSYWETSPLANHWEVVWDFGIAEPGSSGAPLFNENHQVIGQLHGGSSHCGGPDLDDYFGSFDKSWIGGGTDETRLSTWLDPTNTGMLTTNTRASSNNWGAVYTFTGTGNWDIAANWKNNAIPPDILTACSIIIIDHANGGECVLNVPQTIHDGAKLWIRKDKQLRVVNNISINNLSPSISTTPVSALTINSAITGGTVSHENGTPITARGICYNIIPTPTLTNGSTVIPAGAGLGSYTVPLNGLQQGTIYYARAYATNSVGTAYGNEIIFTTVSTNCNPFTVTHTAGNVAPVTKTVTYETNHSSVSGSSQCWIMQNLGSDHPATAANDGTEASAGWYWQFNRKQGYKHDGTVRTPNTAWITNISENSNWFSTNDPCNILLGAGWRIPTYTEWNNTNTWNDMYASYASVLKLHSAGYLYYTNGSLQERNRYGFYRSSTQSSSDISWAWHFIIGEFQSNMDDIYGYKSYGGTIRCVLDIPATLSTLTTEPVTAVTNTTATGHGTLVSDGGSHYTSRGVCYSTSPNPTLGDASTLAMFNPNSAYTCNITGLNPGNTYYLRAFATNSIGTAYGNVVSFTTSFTCGNTLTINHVEGGNIVPVTKTVNYGTVQTSLAGSDKCWITRNLGADNQASSSSDNAAAARGWIWQFNRRQGYQVESNIRTPNSPWITDINESSDWVSSNDPCNLLLGNGWRIPTYTEWSNVRTNGGWNNQDDAYASVLKMHSAGYYNAGFMVAVGSNGIYWSSTQLNDTKGYMLGFTPALCVMSNQFKYYGLFVRCLKD